MKKVFVFVMALVIALSLFAACGKQAEPVAPAEDKDVSDLATLGEALALAGKEEEQNAVYENVYVYALQKDGVYWRLTAPLTAEQSAALFSLDLADENYETKKAEIVAPLDISNCENLSERMLTEADLSTLAGKTGEDLLNDGWTSGSGYNLEEMEFNLERGPFAYTVVFEAGEPLENSDDFDELEAIRPLTIRSVAFAGLGGGATDLPEYAGE